jgi:hypothetical protein
MTDQQITQWNLDGCVSRCLIRLANMSGNPINRDGFAAQFEQFFVDPANHYGGLDESRLPESLELLGLPTEPRMSDKYSVIHDYFHAGHNYTLVKSQIDLQPGHTNEGKHCSVLTGIDPEFFSLWTPCQNGDDIPLHLPKADWAAKRCFGITLF